MTLDNQVIRIPPAPSAKPILGKQSSASNMPLSHTKPKPSSFSQPVHHLDEQWVSELLAKQQQERNMRKDLCPDLAMSSASWLMACDLYAGYLNNERRLVTAVCAMSGAPNTTAIRWLRAMENSGVVKRNIAPNDKRMHLIQMTNVGLFQMNKWVAWMYSNE